MRRSQDRAGRGSWNWEVVLVERVKNRVREIAVPTQDEISQAEGSGWAPTRDLGTIPHGQETKVLLRHGFKDWADLYPRRQRAVTEALLALCAAAAVDDALRNVLRLAILGTTEMAGYLSRWDRWYLKSYESMANHRFDFTTLPTEPNVWGTSTSGRGTVLRRLRLLLKASRWLAKRTGKRLVVEGPLSIDRLRSPMRSTTDARIVGGSSERIVLPARSVDLVLTDPPYHDDVQYHELSLPLRAWAELATEALEGEAVVNHATRQNLDGLQYRELLTRIFSETRRILRPTGHLIFTYGNRRPEPWVDVLAALQEAGFRAAGYAILQSENETDASTSETGPCSLDLVMDVVPDGDVRVRTWKPPKVVGTPEGEFLAIIGNAFLRIGDVTEGWETTLLRRLRRSRWV